MSRTILCRPRTRVYGCNYDKGESYYKPAIAGLDRKYSGRPLFPEARTSLADEISARRSDIGSRDLSGARNSPADFESRLLQSPFEDEETVFDIRGQKTSRPKKLTASEDFASEVIAKNQKIREKIFQNTSSNENLLDNFNVTSATSAALRANQAFEEAENLFQRNRKAGRSAADLEQPSSLNWSKLTDDSDKADTSAIRRAMRTQARLNDLEDEMEEFAEKQKNRERRSAALRAFVNESEAVSDKSLFNLSKQSSVESKNTRSRRSEWTEKKRVAF